MICFDKVCCWVLGLFLAGCLLVSDVSGQNNVLTQDLTEGWQYRWGDSPLDEMGRPIWASESFSSEGWQAFSFSDPPDDRQSQEFMWMRVRLPAEEWVNPVLYIETLLVAGEVYLDGKKIDELGTLKPSSENKYRTISWHLVPLPSDFSEKVLMLRIYSNYQSVIGLSEPPRLGYQADVIRSILMENMDEILLGVLFLIIGPASLLLYVRRRDLVFSAYLSFGAFTTCIGVFMTTLGSGPGLFPFVPVWVYYLNRMAFFLFPVGMFAFLEEVLSPGPWRIMRRIWQFHIAFALVGFVLDLLEIIVLPILTFFLFAILAVDILVTMWVGIRAAQEGNDEARIVSVGIGILLLSGLYDIAADGYGLIPNWHNMFQWGVFAFVVSLGYTIERRFVEAHRQLKETNEELSEEIVERKQAQEALEKAHAEVESLKDRLQTENVYLQEELKLEHNFEEIVTHSDALKSVLRQVEQVASTDSTVLILGETGTGKELIARAVHNISPRRERPLVKVNCAALPENLIESELFGHEKGAFTSALTQKVGRFELADGGTIFLDEIGDLPLELQAKLLRVLQEGEFERLGDTKTLTVDVRVIAATNRDLEDAAQKGDFREDLFYRLNVFPIECPALRKRKEDIPLLVHHFVQKYGPKSGKSIEVVPQAVINSLQDYDWPGNVRELENMIERAVIISTGNELAWGDWLSQARDVSVATPTLEELERKHIVDVLTQTHWRVSGDQGAAKILGLKRTTLESRMKRLGIERPT